MRLSALLCVTAMALAQTPAASPGTVSGVVLDAVTGAPIRKAAVTFRLKRQDVRIATAESSGRFQVSGLTPGDYRITAVARGYVPLDNETAIGSARSMMAFSVAGGQTLASLVLRLTPAAAISGRIVDEDDDPMSGVPVQLWTVRYSNGRREFASVHAARVTTDDRGMYRIAEVAPGNYYLSAFHRHALEASPALQDDLRYVRTFYPGGTVPATATPVQLAGGAELQNINWRLSKVQTVRISGRVPGNTQFFANLMPDGPLAHNDSAQAAKVAPDGSFEFSQVIPGSYTLAVSGHDGGWAFRPVMVGPSGVTGLTIPLASQIRLEGRVRIEGDVEANLKQLRVVLSPLFLGNFTQTVQPLGSTGSFAWDKIIPGRFRLSLAGLPPGFYLKSVRLGNQTLPDGRLLDLTAGAAQVLDLQVSPKAAQVTGIVMSTDSSQPVAETPVILVPDEPGRQGDIAQYAHTVTDTAGRFVLRNVPPGAYRAYVVHSVQDNLYMDPLFRQRYEEQSVAFAVGESGQATLKLNWKH